MLLKQCVKCGLYKPINEFVFRDKKKGTYRNHCRLCHSKYASNRYHQNKETLDATQKEKQCIRCGYHECVEALDYHHLEPSSKKDTVSSLLTHYNVEDGLKEINKCILLCSNCHRYFHYLERKNNITLQEFINVPVAK